MQGMRISIELLAQGICEKREQPCGRPCDGCGCCSAVNLKSCRSIQRATLHQPARCMQQTAFSQRANAPRGVFLMVTVEKHAGAQFFMRHFISMCS